MRYLAQEIKKTPEQVVIDILCRTHKVMKDKLVAKSKYRIGVVRITGNEPTLQWEHLIEVIKIIDEYEKLVEICNLMNFDEKAADVIFNSKLILETNGILVGMGKVRIEELEQIENIEMDIDISFKGVNSDQFEWLSDRPSKYFWYQIDGFVELFDFAESLDNINVNPVLGINHAPNYCVWCKGKKYIMDVEIVDKFGNKLDFMDYSKDFEENVLSRKELRFDEAPFREYFGINKDRARLVVAVVYNGRRYLNVLPSEIPKLCG